jgi:acyl-CoA reductase-like NAD-dependent aldehyde dehydrogenase
MKVFSAFDRKQLSELDEDNETSLERKLDGAVSAFAHRDSWLRPYQRIDILRKLAQLMESKCDHLARQIASEGGKPLTDAIVETDRAIDGVRNAIEILRTFGGREIPMGITPASDSRWAFTIREPIGVVAGVSAFNHPLNLIH